MEPDDVTAYDTYALYLNNEPYECPDSGAWLGKWCGSVSGGTRYIYVAFLGTHLDNDSAITEFESVSFVSKQLADLEDFYPDGAVNLTRLSWGDITQPSVLDLVAQDPAVTLATSDTPNPTLSMTKQFNVLWKTERQFLYRLSPAASSPVDSDAVFDCDGFHLTVTYLIP